MDPKDIAYRLFRIYAKVATSVGDNPGLDADYWIALIFDTYDLCLDLLGAPPEAPDAFLDAPPGLSWPEKYDLMHPRTAYNDAWDEAMEAIDLEDKAQSRAVFDKMWAVWETIQRKKGLL